MTGRGWRRLTVQNWFVVMIAAITIVVGICTVVGAVMLERTNRLSDHLTDRLSPARIEGTELQTVLVDQETGVRGYLLTDNRQFLEPYASGVVAERRQYELIEGLLRDRPDLVKGLHEIRDAAAAWRKEYAEPLIADKQAGKEISAVAGGERQARLRPGPHPAGRPERPAVQGAGRRPDRAGRGAQPAQLGVHRDADLLPDLRRRHRRAAPPGRRPAAGRAARGRPARGRGRLQPPASPAHGPADMREVARDVEAMRTRIVAALEASREHEAMLSSQPPTRRAGGGAAPLQRRAGAVRLRRLPRPAGAAAQGRLVLPAAAAALRRPARRARPTSTSTSPSTAPRACRC